MTELGRIGQHCAEKSCHQLDFLPFTCKYCSQVFCLDHRSQSNHTCTDDITLVNTLPDCPICGQTIAVGAKDNVDEKMNRHISTGCQTGLYSAVESQRKAMQKVKKTCHLSTCRNSSNYDTVACPSCKYLYCLTHRHAETHDCKSMLETSGPKQNKAATSLLAKLRADGATGSSGRRGPPKKAAALRAAAAAKRNNSNAPPTAMDRTRLRMTAVGDATVAERERLFLQVVYPKSYISKKTNSISMWFHQDWTVGKVIDNVCKHTKLENRNNEKKAKHLHLRGRNNMEFPTDISLQLLAPALSNGDTITLKYVAPVS